MRLETIQPNDSPELRKQIAELRGLGYRVLRYTEYQLKIGPVSYYPTTGRIMIDPAIKHPEKGFDALLELLERSRGPKIISL
jgi:hypothetical protein